MLIMLMHANDTNNMDRKLIILFLILGLGVWLVFKTSANLPAQTGQKAGSTLNNQSTDAVQLINSEEFDALLFENENAFVVDVHAPEQTHIPGTDAFIDYTKIKDSVLQLPEDKDTPIIVYCRSGSMSAQASEDLVELGYTRVYDLAGGTNAYKESGRRSVSIFPDIQPLGTVNYGDVPETEFLLTNYTDQVLNVTKLSTSCGCTKAFMDHREVPAFTTMPVRVTFDPAVHGDATDLGELTRTIYIETDNSDFAKMEVTITANVIKN